MAHACVTNAEGLTSNFPPSLPTAQVLACAGLELRLGKRQSF